METLSASTVWYFAYGSNMSPSVLTDKSGIHPRRALLVKCPDYALAFNVPGVPFLELAMAGLRRIRSTKDDIKSKEMSDRANLSDKIAVHGIAYEISSKELDRIFATEDGGIAYRFANARVEILSNMREDDGSVKHDSLDVVTLVVRKPIDADIT
jgi:hypothetical protein